MSSRRSIHLSLAFGAAGVVVMGALCVGLYLSLAWWVTAWRFHAELAEVASAAICGVALLAGVAVLHGKPRHHGHDDHDEDDGPDGGEPRRSVPRVPRSPDGVGPAWDEFDRLRADWDRVPSGSR